MRNLALEETERGEEASVELMLLAFTRMSDEVNALIDARTGEMEKARDVLYGSPLYNEFTEFGAAMQTYNDFGIDTEKITSEVQRRIDAGEISLKMAGEITPVSRSWTDVDGVCLLYTSDAADE